MENSSDLPEAQKEHVAGIRSSADDLQRIITDVLDLSKLENGSMQIETISFDLREVAETALDSVAHLAHAKGLELYLGNAIDTDPISQLLGDPFRIKQCLLNLLGNAIRFTANGYIKLQWSITSSPIGGENLVFMVEDSGIGISPESQKQLFRPFSQVDASIQRKWGGTGLGLSITQNLAQLMGGSAWCESAEGKGSTFSFSVVVRQDLKVAAPRYAVMGMVAPVLLICPPSPTTTVLSRNLERMNIRTILVTPIEAASYCGDMSTVMIDSAYSDLAMSFVHRLSVTQSRAKVVFLTELTDRANLLNRISDPLATVITKPLKARALLGIIDQSTIPACENAVQLQFKTKTVSLIDREMAFVSRSLLSRCDLTPLSDSVFGTSAMSLAGVICR